MDLPTARILLKAAMYFVIDNLDMMASDKKTAVRVVDELIVLKSYVTRLRVTATGDDGLVSPSVRAVKNETIDDRIVVNPIGYIDVGFAISLNCYDITGF